MVCVQSRREPRRSGVTGTDNGASSTRTAVGANEDALNRDNQRAHGLFRRIEAH